jgi:hypothetical protein
MGKAGSPWLLPLTRPRACHVRACLVRLTFLGLQEAVEEVMQRTRWN